MKKFKSILMGTAALLAFTACSSDDPTPGTNTNPDGPDANMYLAVNINTAGSRAEGGYDRGDEHKVNSADFFFFDAEGHYLTKGNVWNEGSSSKPEDPDKNVEFKSNSLVILKGLKDKNLPKYVVTVLNAPSGLATKVERDRLSITELARQTDNYYTENKETKEKYYVMTTSSYYDGVANHDKFYNATYLADDMLIPESELPEKVSDIPASKRVEIYVERLAAKYSLDEASKNLTSKLQITISADDNNGTIDPDVTATEIEIAITGFGVTNTEGSSFLSKNIDGWSFTVKPDAAWAGQSTTNTWNVPGDFRSHWGKSVNYDNATAAGFVAASFPAIKGKYLAYSNETTKALAKLQMGGDNTTLNRQLTPCFVITAEAKIKGAATTLVEYNGLYYYEKSFKNYVLDKLNRTGKLNFYKLVGETTETETTDDKTIITEGKKYTQIGADNIKYVRATGTKNDKVKLVYAGAETDKLYAKTTGGGAGTMAEAAVSTLNANLLAFFTNTGSYASYFNGGAMYYTIPVEHLLGDNDSKDFKVEKEGEYGTVRNHWYQLALGKILNMGHGVFDPDDTTNGDVIEIENPSEKYGLSCNINVLSWKLVFQTSDL